MWQIMILLQIFEGTFSPMHCPKVTHGLNKPVGPVKKLLVSAYILVGFFVCSGQQSGQIYVPNHHASDQPFCGIRSKTRNDNNMHCPHRSEISSSSCKTLAIFVVQSIDGSRLLIFCCLFVPTVAYVVFSAGAFLFVLMLAILCLRQERRRNK